MERALVTVLVVDGNPDDVKLLQDALAQDESSLFHVTVAPRLDKALEELEAHKFDALLIAPDLPDSTGQATLNKIGPLTCGTPILVLSKEGLGRFPNDQPRAEQDVLVTGAAGWGCAAGAIRNAIERRQAQAKIAGPEAEKLKMSAEAGKLIGSSAIERDITGRKRMEEKPAEMSPEPPVRRELETYGELALVLAIGLLVFAISSYFHFFNFLSSMILSVSRGTNIQFDEFLVALVAMIPALGFFSYRHSRQARVEIEKRLKVQEALGSLQVDLETRVQERTADLEQSNVSLRAQIIERERVEVALSESNIQFRTLFESSPEAIMLLDPSNNFAILDCNSAACRMNGYTRAELVGQSVDMFNLTASNTTEDAEYVERIRQAGVLHFESWHRRKDGTVFPIEVSTTLISVSGREMVLGIDRDITERKQAEEALINNEKRFRFLIENGLDNISLLAADGTLLWESPAVIRTLGYAPDVFIGMNIFQLMHPDDLDWTSNAFGTLLREPGSRQQGSFRLKHSDGSWRWIEAVAANMLDEPSVQALVINYRDISERKQAEQALRESEGKFRSFVEQSAEGMVLIDEQGMIIEWNQAEERITGIPRSKAIGVPFGDIQYQILPPERRTERSAEFFNQALSEAFKTGQIALSADSSEIAIRTVTGEDKSILQIAFPIRTKDGYRVGAIVRDVTERTRTAVEIKHHLAELEAVNEISTALRAAQTLDQMLPLLLDTTLRVLDSRRGSIWLYDSARDELKPVITRGWSENANVPPSKPGEGIAGHVFVTGQPLVSSDFHLDELLTQDIRQNIEPGTSGVTVPIRVGDHVIGSLTVNVPLPRELTENNIRLLTTVSEIAGNAIQRTRLLEQSLRRERQLFSLHTIDMAISSSFDLQLTLDIMLDEVITQLGVDTADVLLFKGDSSLEYAAGRGFRTKGIEQSLIRLGEGNAGMAALERRIYGVAEIGDAKPKSRGKLLAGEGFVAHYAAPLVAKGKLKGILEVFHRAALSPEPEWLNFLETLAGQAAIAIDSSQLFSELQASNLQLSLAYDATIEGWSHALDLRDKETEGHTQRVAELTLRLARAAGIGDAELVHIRRGALLHDIGKMGIPDAILFKAGPLTEEEWVIMRQHPTYAYELLSPIRYLRQALAIPHFHHEWWDGTGYPMGLKGEAIPFAARLFAVVDVWDALCSDRPYRRAWSKAQALEHLSAQAGTHFDPEAVRLFLEIKKE